MAKKLNVWAALLVILGIPVTYSGFYKVGLPMMAVGIVGILVTHKAANKR